MPDTYNEPVEKWLRSETRLAIERKFRFASRSQAWGFVARTACLLDTGEFSLEWSDVRVKVILTWDEGEPLDAAVALASEINALL